MKNLVITLMMFIFFGPPELISQLTFNGIIDYYPAIMPSGERMLSTGDLLVYGHVGTCRGAKALLLDTTGRVRKEITLDNSVGCGYSWYMGAIELHPDTILLWGYSQYGDDFPGGEHIFVQKQSIQSSWSIIKALDSLSSMPEQIFIDIIQLNQGEHIISLYNDTLLILDRDLNIINTNLNPDSAFGVTHLTPLNDTLFIVNFVTSASIIYNLDFEVQVTLPFQFKTFQYLDDNLLIQKTGTSFILYDHYTQLFDTIPYDFGGIEYERVQIDPDYIYLSDPETDSVFLMRVSHDLLYKETFALPRNISDWEGYQFYKNLFFSYFREGFQSESLYAEIMNIDHPAYTKFHDISIDSAYITHLVWEPFWIQATLDVIVSNHGSDTLREFVLHTQPYYVFNCVSVFPYAIYRNTNIPPGGSGIVSFVQTPYTFFGTPNTLTICIGTNHGNQLLDNDYTNNGFCLFNIVSGMSEAEVQLCRIYPNPFAGKLYIESDKVREGVEIYNLYGQLVYGTNIKKQYYEIEFDSGPGLYLVKVKMKDAYMFRWITKL